MRFTRHLSLLLLSTLAAFVQAETGAGGWLRYAPLTNTAAASYASLPSQIVVLGNTPTDQTAASELQRGLTSMLGRPFTVSNPGTLSDEDRRDVIFLTSIATLSRIATVDQTERPVVDEDFLIRSAHENGHMHLLLLGGTPQSELYAVFHLLEEIASQQIGRAHV